MPEFHCPHFLSLENACQEKQHHQIQLICLSGAKVQKGWISVCNLRLMIPFSASRAVTAPPPACDTPLINMTLMHFTVCSWQPELLKKNKI